MSEATTATKAEAQTGTETREEVGRFRKNAREEVVVALTTWQGHELLDVRAHALDPATGRFTKPTVKGLTVNRRLIGDLIDLLQQAEEASRE